MNWERKNRIEFKKKGILSKEFTPIGCIWKNPLAPVSLREAYKARQRKKFRDSPEFTVEELMRKIGYETNQ